MDYASQQRKPTKHLVGIVAVVLMHLVLVWALQNGLARKVMSLVKKPIDAKLIEEVKPKTPDTPPPPPPPPPKNMPPPDYVPPPDITPAAAPVQAPANVITAVTQAPKVETPPPPPAPPPPPPPPKPMVRVAPVVSASACEKPEYPAVSRRQEEQGTVVLRFLVAEDGRVIDSKVDTSSGFPRLDEAARSALSKCKFKPGTLDGAPEQAWTSMKYTWRLE